MGKIIIYTNSDTGILVSVIPAYGDLARPENESDDEFLSRVIQGAVPEGATYRVVDPGDLPVNGYFRDQWEDTGVRVVVNMDRARLHHMGAIRCARDKELQSLDVPFLRAVEKGDAGDQRRLANLKQELRDIPQLFDLVTGCETPEQLEQRWPQNLAL